MLLQSFGGNGGWGSATSDSVRESLSGQLIQPTHPLNICLLDYWESLRGSSSAPDRTALDPLHFPSIVGHLSIIESTIHHYRFRLYGTATAELTGIDLTGQRFDHETTHRLGGGFLDDVLWSIRSVAPSIRQGAITGHRSILPFERILLPLRGSAGAVNGVLAGFQCLDPSITSLQDWDSDDLETYESLAIHSA